MLTQALPASRKKLVEKAKDLVKLTYTLVIGLGHGLLEELFDYKHHISAGPLDDGMACLAHAPTPSCFEFSPISVRKTN